MGKKRKQKDWRKARQDPEVYRKMEYVAEGLTLLSLCSMTGYAVSGRWQWYLPAMACVAAAVVLDILLPQYFTLITTGKGEKKRAWELEFVILLHGLFLMLMPWKNWCNRYLFWVVFAVCGAGFAAVLGCFAEEFKREKEYLIVVFVLGGFLGAFMTGHINETFAMSEPRAYILTVEELYGQNRNRTERNCTVTLPDGTQMKLNISKGTCNALEVDGPVRVEVGTGMLGIEYANAYPVE